MTTRMKRWGTLLEVALPVFPWIALVGVTLVGVSMLPFSDTNRPQLSTPTVTSHGERRAPAPVNCESSPNVANLANLAILANTDASPDAGVAQVPNCPPGLSAQALPHPVNN